MPVYAVDTSVWPRCDAECSPQRGYYYHPSRHSAGQPIVAGWAYQFVARLGFVRESWTAPVCVVRVRPDQEANAVATEQVEALLGRLEEGEAIPLFVFDAGYDPVKLQRALWRGGRASSLSACGRGVASTATPACAIRASACRTPTSPRTEDEVLRSHKLARALRRARVRRCAGHGTVRVRAWAKMHPKVQNHEGRGTRRPLPIAVGTLILVEVERLPRGERRREPRVLWLWWHGPEGTEPDLELIWRSYVRRFDLKHTFRFLKQTLFGWVAPRVRHPDQADRWTTWVVVAAYTQLRLARGGVLRT